MRDGQSEKGGHSQVKGHLGHQAGELDQQGDDELAIVIVVEIPPGEVGIVRREIRRLGQGVEEGDLHHLFPAEPGLPEVGVQDANADERQEGHREEAFLQEDQATGRRGGLQAHPYEPVTASPAIEKKRAPSQERDGSPGHWRAIGHQAQAAPNPYQIGRQQQADPFRQAITTIAKARENAVHNRPNGQPDHFQHQPPSEDGHEGSARRELVPAAIPEHGQLVHRLIQHQGNRGRLKARRGLLRLVGPHRARNPMPGNPIPEAGTAGLLRFTRRGDLLSSGAIDSVDGHWSLAVNDL